MHRDLKNDIRIAVAWGVSDIDSVGYSQSELTKLLGISLARIIYLETTLRENKVPFTETDWKRREHIRDI